MPNATPYAELTPDVVLEAVDGIGHLTDGRILALNSYENRVYQLGLEDGGFVVVKFYRPERWTDAAIREEHAFAHELAQHEIPVVAPLTVGGDTLHTHAGFRFAVFPRQGGRWPELATDAERAWMGRFLARIHAVGAGGKFAARRRLSPAWLGRDAAETILASAWLPAHLRDGYAQITAQLLERIDALLAEVGAIAELRIHGDCHPGNVLWTDDGPHFVDLDDCMTGPAVQDLWLFLSGDTGERASQLAQLLEGYLQFRPFDYRELRLIEPLRTLRIMHHTAWIARRWPDPAFPRAFPWFDSNKYWEEHVLALKEQLAALDEPPLAVY